MKNQSQAEVRGSKTAAISQPQTLAALARASAENQGQADAHALANAHACSVVSNCLCNLETERAKADALILSMLALVSSWQYEGQPTKEHYEAIELGWYELWTALSGALESNGQRAWDAFQEVKAALEHYTVAGKTGTIK